MRIPHNERVSSDITGEGPERKCILSGDHAARDALIRLAISPDGVVLPDVLALWVLSVVWRLVGRLSCVRPRVCLQLRFVRRLDCVVIAF